jgi:hypothetical protein
VLLSGTTAAARAGDGAGGPADYYVDTLLRGDQATTESVSGATRAEVMKIFGTSLQRGSLSTEDQQYLGRIVARRSGLSQAEAENRVAAIYARFNQSITDAESNVKQAVDNARRAAANASLWMFIALLVGAFCASLCATYGGKWRDQVVSADASRRGNL